MVRAERVLRDIWTERILRMERLVGMERGLRTERCFWPIGPERIFGVVWMERS